jgi:hypothetical protein
VILCDDVLLDSEQDRFFVVNNKDVSHCISGETG